MFTVVCLEYIFIVHTHKHVHTYMHICTHANIICTYVFHLIVNIYLLAYTVKKEMFLENMDVCEILLKSLENC